MSIGTKLIPIRDNPCPRGCGRDSWELDAGADGKRRLHFTVCTYEPPRPPTLWQRIVRRLTRTTAAAKDGSR